VRLKGTLTDVGPPLRVKGKLVVLPGATLSTTITPGTAIVIPGRVSQ
jgi:hypothetical protein